MKQATELTPRSDKEGQEHLSESLDGKGSVVGSTLSIPPPTTTKPILDKPISSNASALHLQPGNDRTR